MDLTDGDPAHAPSMRSPFLERVNPPYAVHLLTISWRTAGFAAGRQTAEFGMRWTRSRCPNSGHWTLTTWQSAHNKAGRRCSLQLSNLSR